MSGELRNYDPSKITAGWSIVGGTLDMTRGLIDGPGAIVDSKDAPPWTRRGDRNSNMVRIKSGKKGGFLTFTYVSESQIKDKLSQLFLQDQETETVVGALKIKDLNGTTVMEYLGCFIENVPDLNYGDTAADSVYVMGYAERVPYHGGAAPL